MSRDELIANYEGMIIKTINKYFWSYSREDKEDYAQMVRMHLNDKYEYITEKRVEVPHYINGIISKIILTYISGIIRSLNQKKAIRTTSLNQISQGNDKEMIDMLEDQNNPLILENSAIIDAYYEKINKMGTKDKKVLEMYFEQDLSLRQIEEETGISKSVVARKVNEFKDEIKGMLYD